MIVNIPLQIDEAAFEQKVNDDYANKVEQLLLAKIEKVLVENDDRYWARDRDAKNGLQVVINRRTDIFLEEHKEEVIEAAGKHLAERLWRTKRGKEILEEVQNDC